MPLKPRFKSDSTLELLVIWNSLKESLNLVNVDSNHQVIVQQDVMARQMVLGEINAPLEYVSVYGAGMAFELAGDYLHPVAAAESVVKTHRLQRS